MGKDFGWRYNKGERCNKSWQGTKNQGRIYPSTMGGKNVYYTSKGISTEMENK